MRNIAIADKRQAEPANGELALSAPVAQPRLIRRLEDLDRTAARINRSHAAAHAKAREALAQARRAGLLLIKVKARLGHGSFLEWIEENCRFTDRTARLYMALARDWRSLGPANRKRISEMGFRQALYTVHALRHPEEEEAAAPPEPVLSHYRGEAFHSIYICFDEEVEFARFQHGLPVDHLTRIVRFKTEREMGIFARLIGQSITANTQVLWIPPRPCSPMPWAPFFRARSGQLDPIQRVVRVVRRVAFWLSRRMDKADLVQLAGALRAEAERIELALDAAGAPHPAPQAEGAGNSAEP